MVPITCRYQLPLAAMTIALVNATGSFRTFSPVFLALGTTVWGYGTNEILSRSGLVLRMGNSDSSGILLHRHPPISMH